MTLAQPRSGKVSIADHGATLSIAFPVRAPPFHLLSNAIMFSAWAYGEASAIFTLRTGHPPGGMRFLFNGVDASNNPDFIANWLAGWTVMGLFLAGMLVFAIAGKEVIELDATGLKRHKMVLGLGRSREYAVASIIDLRPALPSVMASYQWNFPLGFKYGTICFDYGRDTHFLGSGLDAADGRYVIEEMCKRVRSLCA